MFWLRIDEISLKIPSLNKHPVDVNFAVAEYNKRYAIQNFQISNTRNGQSNILRPQMTLFNIPYSHTYFYANFEYF